MFTTACCLVVGFSASKMTYIVSGGALNSTHSLSSRVSVRIWDRIRFSVWLVCCYAHVFVLP